VFWSLQEMMLGPQRWAQGCIETVPPEDLTTLARVAICWLGTARFRFGARPFASGNLLSGSKRSRRRLAHCATAIHLGDARCFISASWSRETLDEGLNIARKTGTAGWWAIPSFFLAWYSAQAQDFEGMSGRFKRVS